MAITTLLILHFLLFCITLYHPPGQSVESNHTARAGCQIMATAGICALPFVAHIAKLPHLSIPTATATAAAIATATS
jgi:hypothetical protein